MCHNTHYTAYVALRRMHINTYLMIAKQNMLSVHYIYTATINISHSTTIHINANQNAMRQTAASKVHKSMYLKGLRIIA